MKVLLGMSGGIDSSAAAVLLKEKGYEVIGVSLLFYDKTYYPDYFSNSLEKSIIDAQKFSGQIGIKHIIVDARNEFKNIVLKYFIGEYLNGRTPFPCIVCNAEVKWAIFYTKMKELGCDYISSGHYVNTIEENGKYYITQGTDDDKDQSFFLWPLPQEILKHTFFPLGNFKKSDVKQLMKSHSIKLAEKKESTGICFLNSDDYRPFLKAFFIENQIKIEEGFFYDEEDNIIGKHQGYPFYTIGQRRGLDINLNKALYIESINVEKNKIILTDKQALNKNILWVENYKVVDKNDYNDEVTIKIRYRKQENTGRIEFLSDNKLKVDLNQPLNSVAPGQAAAFYKNNKLLGGGIIYNSQ